MNIYSKRKHYYTKCKFCSRKIRQNNRVVRLAHRRCWLKNRKFNDRKFDYLFCNERSLMNKYYYIKSV